MDGPTVEVDASATAVVVEPPVVDGGAANDETEAESDPALAAGESVDEVPASP